MRNKSHLWQFLFYFPLSWSRIWIYIPAYSPPHSLSLSVCLPPSLHLSSFMCVSLPLFPSSLSLSLPSSLSLCVCECVLLEIKLRSWSGHLMILQASHEHRLHNFTLCVRWCVWCWGLNPEPSHVLLLSHMPSPIISINVVVILKAKQHNLKVYHCLILARVFDDVKEAPTARCDCAHLGPSLGRLRQEAYEFEANPGYIMRLFQKFKGCWCDAM